MRPIQCFSKQLEGTRITRKGDPNPQVPAPPFAMVAEGGQCTYRPIITTNITCSANIYRCTDRRVGRSLRRAHCKRNMVPSGKQAAYKLSRTKSSLSGFKKVPRPLLKQDNTCSNRQHRSSVIHKQGRRHEIGPPTLCPTMENLDLVCQETSDSKARHFPGRLNVVADKLSMLGQTMQTEWFLLPEVSLCSRWHLPKIDLFATRFNNKLPLFVSLVLDPLVSSGCAQSAMVGSGSIHLLTISHIGQSGGEVAGLPMQENHSDCSGEAQHALVLGSSGHVQPNPTEPAQSAQPVHSHSIRSLTEI